MLRFGAGIQEEQRGRFLDVVRRGHEVSRCEGRRTQRVGVQDGGRNKKHNSQVLLLDKMEE